jgi:2,3-bisphosphoglycerate-independent phosphoglycerate mutase
MALKPVAPVVLTILDGWGYRENQDGNAIAHARTPYINSLWTAYPHTTIQTSGRAVGLPDGQMGNSEVGHLNIGAGRVVPQELVRISDAVKDKSILTNPALVKLCQETQSRKGKLHAIGLCSDGGVHSHLEHLTGLLELAKQQGFEQIYIHAITDGRDTNPQDAIAAITQIEGEIERVGIGKIVTISGRYYAMDRDNRWDRVKLAYQAITEIGAGTGQTPLELIESSYAQGKTDEFILPTRIAPGEIAAGDGVIFFNFRPDRARELTGALVLGEFTGFERTKLENLSFVTFTQYDPRFPVDVAFVAEELKNLLGEVIANNGLKQFRTAETEKYAHVTYFFNGGREVPFPGEDVEMIASPQVSTYDLAPAMSAAAVTDAVVKAIERGIYALIVVNYANPDMVGHTGKMEPTIAAIEAVDRCVGRLSAAVSKASGTMIISADHGNAEYMWDEQGNPWTAHTTNAVPLILIEGEGRKIPGHGTDVLLRSDGKLADIAPTILEILQIPQPPEMNGRSLIAPAPVDIRANRSPMRVGV